MKSKIKTIVVEHKPFLQTLETKSELSFWVLSMFGILNPNQFEYLHTILLENGIDANKLTNSWANGITFGQNNADLKKYEEKVENWNQMQK